MQTQSNYRITQTSFSIYNYKITTSSIKHARSSIKYDLISNEYQLYTPLGDAYVESGVTVSGVLLCHRDMRTPSMQARDAKT